MIAIDGEDEIFLVLSVGALGPEALGFLLPFAHADDGLFETDDDVAVADGELNRIASIGRVELRSVVERSFVMHVHDIAAFRFWHR